MARERTARGFAGQILEVLVEDMLAHHGAALLELLLGRRGVTLLRRVDVRLRSAVPGARSVWLDALLVCRDRRGRFLLDIELKTGEPRARDRRQLASQVMKLDEQTRPGEEHAGLPFEVVLARAGDPREGRGDRYERRRGKTGLACRWQVFRFRERIAGWYARRAPVALSVLCPLGRDFSPPLYGVALGRILAVPDEERRAKLIHWLDQVMDLFQPEHDEEHQRMRNHRLSKAEKEEQDLVWRVHATLLGKERLEGMMEASEKRGEKRGLQIGEQAGLQKAILAVIERRFGAVPEPLVRRVRAMRSCDRLGKLLDRAVTVRRVESLLD